MNFWEQLCNLCQNKGVKPNTVAKAVGLSNATTTKWKNGAIPNGEALIKIADYFDCSVDYLLGRASEPHVEIIKTALPDGTAVEYGKRMGTPDLTPEEIMELREFLRAQRARREVQENQHPNN